MSFLDADSAIPQDPGLGLTSMVHTLNQPEWRSALARAAEDISGRSKHVKEAVVLLGVAVTLLGLERVLHHHSPKRRGKEIHKAATASAATGSLSALVKGWV